MLTGERQAARIRSLYLKSDSSISSMADIRNAGLWQNFKFNSRCCGRRLLTNATLTNRTTLVIFLKPELNFVFFIQKTLFTSKVLQKPLFSAIKYSFRFKIIVSFEKKNCFNLIVILRNQGYFTIFLPILPLFLLFSTKFNNIIY